MIREIMSAVMPAVVFTTAYDRYTVEAFELAARDDLLEPYTAERCRQALGRVQASATDRSGAALRDDLAARLEGRVA